MCTARSLTGELVQRELWFPRVNIRVGFGQVARLRVVTMTSRYSGLPTLRVAGASPLHDVGTPNIAPQVGRIRP